MQDEALAQLNKQALRSKKFIALLVGLVLSTAVGLLSIKLRADSALVGVILGNIVLLVSGYVGSTAWQDRAVRLAAVQKGKE